MFNNILPQWSPIPDLASAAQAAPIHSKVVGGGVLKETYLRLERKQEMGKEKSNKTRIVALRLSPQQFDLLERKFKGSTCRKLSEYIRKVILEKLVVFFYQKGSPDDSVKELIQLWNELNNIGNNFN